MNIRYPIYEGVYRILTAERPKVENWHFSKCGDFQRKVHAMFCHSVALPVSTFRYASTSTLKQCNCHASFLMYWRTVY